MYFSHETLKTNSSLWYCEKWFRPTYTSYDTLKKDKVMSKKYFDFNIWANAGNDNIKIGYDSSSSNTTVYNNVGIGINPLINCVCCGRSVGLPSGGRGLCDGCEEDIPDYIPEEQYLVYMKELWRKK